MVIKFDSTKFKKELAVALTKEIKSKLNFPGSNQLQIKISERGGVQISGPDELVAKAAEKLGIAAPRAKRRIAPRSDKPE